MDELVARQVLQVLEPASVELALQAEEQIQREQERLEKHWQQELERSRYVAPSGDMRTFAITAG